MSFPDPGAAYIRIERDRGSGPIRIALRTSRVPGGDTAAKDSASLQSAGMDVAMTDPKMELSVPVKFNTITDCQHLKLNSLSANAWGPVGYRVRWLPSPEEEGTAATA